MINPFQFFFLPIICIYYFILGISTVIFVIFICIAYVLFLFYVYCICILHLCCYFYDTALILSNHVNIVSPHLTSLIGSAA